MKNALESIGNREDHMEERISKSKERNLEMIKVENERILRSERKKKKEIPWELSNSIRKRNIRIMVILEEEREKGAESLFKDITADNLPYLGNELDMQAHEAKRTPNYLNAKRPSPWHIRVNCQSQWQRNNLKAAMEKKDLT